MFQEYRRRGILKLEFDHRDDSHVPATWSEYQTLMADDGTYPDIILLHAIARLYRCQIVLYLRDDVEVPYIVIAPPDAFRRIFLFTTARLKSANWAQPVGEDANGEDVTFQAPPLVPPPDVLAPHDDALHSLYNRLELSDERLSEIFKVHNGYTGHPGVERTVQHERTLQALQAMLQQRTCFSQPCRHSLQSGSCTLQLVQSRRQCAGVCIP